MIGLTAVDATPVASVTAVIVNVLSGLKCASAPATRTIVKVTPTPVTGLSRLSLTIAVSDCSGHSPNGCTFRQSDCSRKNLENSL